MTCEVEPVVGSGIAGDHLGSRARMRVPAAITASPLPPLVTGEHGGDEQRKRFVLLDNRLRKK
jgi:hypothetical protein